MIYIDEEQFNTLKDNPNCLYIIDIYGTERIIGFGQEFIKGFVNNGY